jgi:hypothetical protein
MRSILARKARWLVYIHVLVTLGFWLVWAKLLSFLDALFTKVFHSSKLVLPLGAALAIIAESISNGFKRKAS